MTDELNIFVRFALYANLMLLFGLPLFVLYVPREIVWHSASGLPLRRMLAMLAAMGVGFSLAGLFVVCAAMAGMPVMGVDRATVQMVVTQTPFGAAWQLRLVALAVAFAASVVMYRSGSRALMAVIAVGAGAALASLAWTGHGAAGEGRLGTVQLAADIIHLLAAGVWVGALAAFGMLLFRSPAGRSPDHIILTHRALERFSSVGTLTVAALVGTGLVNSYALIGFANLPTLPATLYGQLLIAKLVLFAAMLGLAAANRFRLTPALASEAGDRSAQIGALRRSLALEAGAAIAILALVAWLGTLAPPLSVG